MYSLQRGHILLLMLVWKHSCGYSYSVHIDWSARIQLYDILLYSLEVLKNANHHYISNMRMEILSELMDICPVSGYLVLAKLAIHLNTASLTSEAIHCRQTLIRGPFSWSQRCVQEVWPHYSFSPNRHPLAQLNKCCSAK